MRPPSFLSVVGHARRVYPPAALLRNDAAQNRGAPGGPRAVSPVPERPVGAGPPSGATGSRPGGLGFGSSGVSLQSGTSNTDSARTTRSRGLGNAPELKSRVWYQLGTNQVVPEQVGRLRIGELEPVAVHVERERDARVAELLLDPLGVPTPHDVPGGEAVPQAVRREVGAAQARQGEHAREVLFDRAAVEWTPGPGHEHPRRHRPPAAPHGEAGALPLESLKHPREVVSDIDLTRLAAFGGRGHGAGGRAPQQLAPNGELAHALLPIRSRGGLCTRAHEPRHDGIYPPVRDGGGFFVLLYCFPAGMVLYGARTTRGTCSGARPPRRRPPSLTCRRGVPVLLGHHFAPWRTAPASRRG